VPRWRRSFGLFSKLPGLGRLTRAVLHATAPGLERNRPKALGMLQYAGTWEGAYLLRRAVNLPEDVRRLEPDLVREGLRRLQPLRLLQRCMDPDPGSNVPRICALESGHYMRNQLLRDCDWAGMAHGVEIRLPLVDVQLLNSVAPFLPGLRAGKGKAALAAAPNVPLPVEVLRREKTGFSVPAGDWLASATVAGSGDRVPVRKGAVSRSWSDVVLNRTSAAGGAMPT
jgi:asparagine synthase (glutamine-hydrolysing)